MKRGSIRRLDSLATDGVERAEVNGPPTAFRIWKAGMNVTDHGPTVFSKRSAELLDREQATRGNRYSIDVDHLSLDKEAPLHNHAAVGWHSLEVRDGDLWAVNVEWTEAVRAGLTKDPPAWKYFSPAYDVDPESGEVISYLNTALTNNPATHFVTALASRQSLKDNMPKASKKMSWGDIKAALDGDDENAKASAYAAIQAAFPDEPEKKEGEDEPEKKDSEDEPEKKDSKAAEDEPEKKDAKKCAGDEPEKKDSSVVASLDAELAKRDARIAALEKRDQDAERKTLIDSHEMTPALAKMLAGESLEYVRRTCAALPKRKSPLAQPISTEHVQATRGDKQSNEKRAPRLSPEEKKKLDEAMGLRQRQDSIHMQGNRHVFPVGASAKKESK